LEHRLSSASSKSESPLVLYDIGMGTAANAIAVISAFEASARQGRNLQIVSFERYPDALAQILVAGDAFPYLTRYRESLHTLLQTGAAEIESRISWKLIPGDFASLDLSSLPPADLIYFDFYSPSTCPELWTQAIFQKLFEKSKSETALITYAAGKSVRSAMLLSGFFVGTGPSTEMKLETTIAAKNFSLLKNPLGLDWVNSLERSSKPFPIDVSENLFQEAFSKIRKHPQFLISRNMVPEDLPALFEHQSDAEANYMVASTRDPMDRDTFEQHWKKLFSDDSIIKKTIILDDQIVGFTGKFERAGKPEVTYWIDKKLWGKGIATLALRKLLEEVNARPLYARCVQDNFGSVRVLEKCGFEKIGTDKFFSRARGKEVDEIVWAMKV
jgi:RimJ/RimL family protein N-acetyltransferase/tRNA U34 5-methylaminomethyl-2-thiouridine-forming methyltransferase MnmC